VSVSGADIGPSVVVHTSVPFGIKHLEEDKEDVCLNLVLPQLKVLLPDLPVASEIKSHKWRYSQVEGCLLYCNFC